MKCRRVAEGLADFRLRNAPTDLGIVANHRIGGCDFLAGFGFKLTHYPISAAVGDEVFRRAPVNADGILASLEAGRPMGTLTANL
jgi:hypothetical protein